MSTSGDAKQVIDATRKPTRGDRRRVAVVCAVLIASTVMVYAQTARFEFTQWDDTKYVTKNANVQRGVTTEAVRWAFTESHASNWHPVTWLSHMLDCQWFGLEPAGPHIVNVVLHVLNVLLLFGLLHGSTGGLWPSAFVAALFALHPLHVESVAWVAERKDVLSTFFGLASMWVYVSYARRGGVVRYAVMAILFSMGLMAKPMLVTLPFVLLLLDYWPLCRVRRGAAAGAGAERIAAPASGRKNRGARKSTRRSHKRAANESAPAQPTKSEGKAGATVCEERSVVFLVLEKAPLLLLVLASSVVTFLVQQRGPAMGASGFISMPMRVANAVVAYVWYVAKTLWPVDLAALYTHPNLPGGTPWVAWQVGGSVLLLSAITVVVVRAKRHRYLLVGWLWFVGTLVPVIGLVQVGNHAYADRYAYIPIIGLFIIVAWGCGDLLSTQVGRGVTWKAGAAAGALTILIACGVGSWRQAKHWRNSVAVRTCGACESQQPHDELQSRQHADGGRRV